MEWHEGGELAPRRLAHCSVDWELTSLSSAQVTTHPHERNGADSSAPTSLRSTAMGQVLLVWTQFHRQETCRMEWVAGSALLRGIEMHPVGQLVAV